jgi:predicted nucleic acid-binding Zn finger protein
MKLCNLRLKKMSPHFQNCNERRCFYRHFCVFCSCSIFLTLGRTECIEIIKNAIPTLKETQYISVYKDHSANVLREKIALS